MQLDRGEGGAPETAYEIGFFEAQTCVLFVRINYLPGIELFQSCLWNYFWSSFSSFLFITRYPAVELLHSSDLNSSIGTVGTLI